MNRPYRRLYPNLPAAEHLTPELVALAAEARTIAARRSEARGERDRLSTDAAEEDAREADRQAAAAAIREGKHMREVGTPGWDDLLKHRELLDMEIGASDSALEAVEREMTAAFAAMQDDNKASGRDALKLADARYRKAITAIATARADYLHARHLHDFLRGASHLPGCGPAHWPPNDQGLPLHTLSRVGEQDYNLRPVTAEKLLTETFATDLAERPAS